MLISPIIYLTPSRTRFFRVPADHALPPGDFVVRMLDKQELRVEEAAIAAFEIPQAEAHALLREEMKQAFQQIKDTVLSPAEPSAAPAPQAEQLLRDLLNLPPGQRPTADHIANGLRPLLTLLSQTLAVATSPDPTVQAQAQHTLAALRATLEKYGFPVDQPIEDLPAQLAAWREAQPAEAEMEEVKQLQGRLKELSET